MTKLTEDKRAVGTVFTETLNLITFYNPKKVG